MLLVELHHIYCIYNVTCYLIITQLSPRQQSEPKPKSNKPVWVSHIGSNDNKLIKNIFSSINKIQFSTIQSTRFTVKYMVAVVNVLLYEMCSKATQRQLEIINQVIKFKKQDTNSSKIPRPSTYRV